THLQEASPVFRKLFTRTGVAAMIGATALAAGTAPAFADQPSRTVTTTIGANSSDDTVGSASFTRTLNGDGTTTVTVMGTLTDGNTIKQSQLCYQDTGPYTERVSPGQCQLSQSATG